MPRFTRALAAAALLAVGIAGSSGTAAARAAQPTLSVEPSTNLSGGQMVTVNGSGYAPGGGVYVQFCAQPTGAIGTAEGRAASCNPDQANDHTIWKTPIDASGTFSVQLKVESSFDAVDCSTQTCGVFTRKDHVGGASDYSQDAFAAVAFAAALGTPAAGQPEAAVPAASQPAATATEAAPALALTGVDTWVLAIAAAALLSLGALGLVAQRKAETR